MRKDDDAVVEEVIGDSGLDLALGEASRMSLELPKADSVASSQ